MNCYDGEESSTESIALPCSSQESLDTVECCLKQSWSETENYVQSHDISLSPAPLPQAEGHVRRSHNEKSSKDDTNLKGAQVAGIIVGTLAFGVLIAVCCPCYCTYLDAKRGLFDDEPPADVSQDEEVFREEQAPRESLDISVYGFANQPAQEGSLRGEPSGSA